MESFKMVPNILFVLKWVIFINNLLIVKRVWLLCDRESQSSTDTALSSEATTPTQNNMAELKIKQEPMEGLENGKFNFCIKCHQYNFKYMTYFYGADKNLDEKISLKKCII